MATEARRARVASAEPVADGVARIRLAWDPGQALGFRAGQWTILQAQDGERLLKRCFSIASAPSDRAGVTYYVERTGPGGISDWFHACRGGEPVEVRGPHGKFPGEGAGPLLLVAFDTGISPAWSVLQDLSERRAEGEFRLLYGWSRHGEAPLAQELGDMSAAWPELTVSILTPEEALKEIPRAAKGATRAAVAGRVKWLDPAKRILLAAGVGAECVVEEAYDRPKPS